MTLTYHNPSLNEFCLKILSLLVLCIYFSYFTKFDLKRLF
jgi:hypothetical protein